MSRFSHLRFALWWSLNLTKIHLLLITDIFKQIILFSILASRIHISWSCRENLLNSDEGFEIVERGKVELKGKGELFTYWLAGKAGYDRPLPDWDAEDAPSHGLKIDDYVNVSLNI